MTNRVLRFMKAASSPFSRPLPVVRGTRIVRASAGTNTGVVQVPVSSGNDYSQVTCRINGGREVPCKRAWKLAAGTYRLRVTSYGPTGRAVVVRVVRIRVMPGKKIKRVRPGSRPRPANR